MTQPIPPSNAARQRRGEGEESPDRGPSPRRGDGPRQSGEQRAVEGASAAPGSGAGRQGGEEGGEARGGASGPAPGREGPRCRSPLEAVLPGGQGRAAPRARRARARRPNNRRRSRRFPIDAAPWPCCVARHYWEKFNSVWSGAWSGAAERRAAEPSIDVDD